VITFTFLPQLHWNNPTQSADFVDSSGLTLYYTPKLRQYDGEVLMVGQISLNIPPGQSSVSFQGTCSGYCTSSLPKSLYITDAVLHMHLLGETNLKI
jgi:Copper type II ascorbate-dependent monooxygenase, C-terminal domain